MSSSSQVAAEPRRYAIGVDVWATEMEATLARTVQCADSRLGQLAEQLAAGATEVQRQALERAAQAKAEAPPPRGPVCGRALSRKQLGQQRTVPTRLGPIRIRRTRGWCARCRQWWFPADVGLRLGDSGTASPALQEAAAMLVAQMPVADAVAALERWTGVKWSPATLDREARRQGQRATEPREQTRPQLEQPEGLRQASEARQLEWPHLGSTLVIEIDAWNIRERDGWGQPAALREFGEAPQRWHWGYGATVFRLDQRGRTAGGRPVISERGYVMTRGGIDQWRGWLWAEAVPRGLLQAERTLVVADGAVWIGNLVADRFGQAEPLLDFDHASQHLWAVAGAVHGEGSAAARRWVEPLLKQLTDGQGP